MNKTLGKIISKILEEFQRLNIADIQNDPSLKAVYVFTYDPGVNGCADLDISRIYHDPMKIHISAPNPMDVVTEFVTDDVRSHVGIDTLGKLIGNSISIWNNPGEMARYDFCHIIINADSIGAISYMLSPRALAACLIQLLAHEFRHSYWSQDRYPMEEFMDLMAEDPETVDKYEKDAEDYAAGVYNAAMVPFIKEIEKLCVKFKKTVDKKRSTANYISYHKLSTTDTIREYAVDSNGRILLKIEWGNIC